MTSRGADLHHMEPAWSGLTEGQVAERLADGAPLTDADLPALMHGLHAARKANAGTADMEVAAAGEVDSVQGELAVLREFVATTGRPPTKLEVDGAPRYGCVACRRLEWACDDHRRRKGSPLPLPPRETWHRDPLPAGLAPYNLVASVAGTADDDWPNGR